MLTRRSDRGAYDIRQSAANLAPPMYFEQYLNQDWVQNAIGGTLKNSSHREIRGGERKQGRIEMANQSKSA